MTKTNTNTNLIYLVVNIDSLMKVIKQDKEFEIVKVEYNNYKINNNAIWVLVKPPKKYDDSIQSKKYERLANKYKVLFYNNITGLVVFTIDLNSKDKNDPDPKFLYVASKPNTSLSEEFKNPK